MLKANFCIRRRRCRRRRGRRRHRRHRRPQRNRAAINISPRSTSCSKAPTRATSWNKQQTRTTSRCASPPRSRTAPTSRTLTRRASRASTGIARPTIVTSSAPACGTCRAWKWAARWRCRWTSRWRRARAPATFSSPPRWLTTIRWALAPLLTPLSKLFPNN